MEFMSQENYYTVEEIANIHGLTGAAIRYQIKKNNLKGCLRGRKYLIKESDYAEFFEWFSVLHPVVEDVENEE